MNVVFYLSAAVAIACVAAAVTRRNAVHALLYLIVSLFAVALVFFTLGAPFAAAIEVIINAGAIMVLFVFVVMLLNQGPQSEGQEREWMDLKGWVAPVVLAAVLLAELGYVLAGGAGESHTIPQVDPKAVGLALFSPYLLGVEMASVLLLAGLIGAYHVGKR